jgi:integrase/recombinase XerC
MLDEFVTYLKLEKRYSAHTVDAYKNDLAQLSYFAQLEFDIDSLNEVNADVLRTWVVNLMDSGASPKTVNRKMSSVKAFFKWGQKFHGWKSSPAQLLTLPKISKRLPSYLEEDQVEEVLDEATFGHDYEGRRDRLILDIFYNTGMRRNELIHLKWKDVDKSNGLVKVFGKRNKERLIPIGPALLEEMESFEEFQGKQNFDSMEGFIFTTSKGKKMYPKLVYSIVNNYLSRVSALKKKSPHLLRHTFATHMLNRGADLTAIKDILGHSSLAATQVYTHNSIEKLKEVYRKSHPKA